MASLNDVQEVQHRYSDLAAKHGTKLEALGWHDGLAHKLRLEIIAAEIPPGVSVLDVGCGFGDLVQYLPPDVDYTGIDSCKAFIDHAKGIYRQRTMIHGDIMRYSIPHDYVVASGILAFYKRDTAFQIIRRMWELASDTLIFNVYEGDLVGDGAHWYDTQDYANWVRSLFIPKWKIEHDYLPDDATLSFYKNKEIMYAGEEVGDV